MRRRLVDSLNKLIYSVMLTLVRYGQLEQQQQQQAVIKISIEALRNDDAAAAASGNGNGREQSSPASTTHVLAYPVHCKLCNFNAPNEFISWPDCWVPVLSSTFAVTSGNAFVSPLSLL